MKKISLAVMLTSLLSPAQDIFAQSDIEEITVVGRAQEYYLERTTNLGSKIDIDMMALPQSVQILNEQLILDQAARDITDLYRSIAGVSEFSYSGVTFRGFRDSGNVFYDGVRGDPYSGFSVPQLFNVERVEVLKGPSAALYGGGEPGGLINYVTKKPTFERQSEFRAIVGNYSTIGASFDSTGGLSETVAYRIGAFYEDQDSFRDNADQRNIEIAGGLLFQFNDNTKLTTTFDLIDQDLGGHRLRGALVDDEGNFLLGRNFNINESFDYQDLDATVLQATLDHKFTDKLSLTTTVRYLDNERAQAYHEPRGWVDVNGDGEANQDDGVIRREYRDQFRANEEISLTADLVYEFELSGIDNQFLFGFDYHDVDTEFDYLRARYEADNVINLNVNELNYGETDPSTYNLTDLNRAGNKTNRYSLYAQNYMELGESWGLMYGARFDHFEETSKASGYEFSDSHVSPRFGITYHPTENASIYLNYSTSFEPASLGDQEDVEGVASLDPEIGTQFEIGIKNEWLDGQIVTTLAAYSIVKEDLAITNPDFIDSDTTPELPELLNLGEVESDGVEFTLVGDLTDNWTMTANYAYNDTVVVRGAGELSNTFGNDERFVNAPEHQAGLWTRYDIESIDSAIAFGVNYVSEQMSFNDQRVKPFTVFDMSWTTAWENTDLQINVNNLFDKEYAVSGFLSRTGHFPGVPREVVAQISYNF